jgi:hypothetical protein
MSATVMITSGTAQEEVRLTTGFHTFHVAGVKRWVAPFYNVFTTNSCTRERIKNFKDSYK